MASFESGSLAEFTVELFDNDAGNEDFGDNGAGSRRWVYADMMLEDKKPMEEIVRYSGLTEEEIKAL